MQELKFINNYKCQIEKNITKTILKHCVDINADENFWKMIDVQQLKNQEIQRNRLKDFRGIGKAEEIKVKVKLKYNDTFVKFLAKDDNNIILRDDDGKPIVEDYIMATIIYQSKKNGNGSIRLNLSKMAYDLQKIFWFSTIKEILNEDNNLIFENDCFKESILLEIFNGEIIISPKMIVDVDNIEKLDLNNNDAKNLLKIISFLMKNGSYRIVTDSDKNKKKFNKIISAGQWKDASEFNGIEQSLQNCIYYLVSEETDNKPVKMYIGEAKNSGGRLCTRVIDGKTYIGHSERPSDFNIHKFCKYRIDVVSSLEALHDAQDAMIGAFNMADYLMFPNGFILTNEQLNIAYSQADKERRCKLEN